MSTEHDLTVEFDQAPLVPLSQLSTVMVTHVCLIQDPQNLTHCGEEAVAFYVHPVVNKRVYTCEKHTPK